MVGFGASKKTSGKPRAASQVFVITFSGSPDTLHQQRVFSLDRTTRTTTNNETKCSRVCPTRSQSTQDLSQIKHFCAAKFGVSSNRGTRKDMRKRGPRHSKSLCGGHSLTPHKRNNTTKHYTVETSDTVILAAKRCSGNYNILQTTTTS